MASRSARSRTKTRLTGRPRGSFFAARTARSSLSSGPMFFAAEKLGFVAAAPRRACYDGNGSRRSLGFPFALRILP